VTTPPAVAAVAALSSPGGTIPGGAVRSGLAEGRVGENTPTDRERLRPLAYYPGHLCRCLGGHTPVPQPDPRCLRPCTLAASLAATPSSGWSAPFLASKATSGPKAAATSALRAKSRVRIVNAELDPTLGQPSATGEKRPRNSAKITWSRSHTPARRTWLRQGRPGPVPASGFQPVLRGYGGFATRRC
jgi:hypothetical protein